MKKEKVCRTKTRSLRSKSLCGLDATTYNLQKPNEIQVFHVSYACCVLVGVDFAEGITQRFTLSKIDGDSMKNLPGTHK